MLLSVNLKSSKISIQESSSMVLFCFSSYIGKLATLNVMIIITLGLDYKV